MKFKSTKEFVKKLSKYSNPENIEIIIYPKKRAITEHTWSEGTWNGIKYTDEGNFALFWSSSEYIGYNAWYRILYYDNGSLPRSYDYFKQDGFSVRLVRD